MWKRQASASLRRLWKQFPAVLILGARQVGKTTLARQSFPKLPYCELEEPRLRELFTADPTFQIESRAQPGLDGAGAAAQMLGREDLPEWFERAWRAGPSVPMLYRWLVSSGNAAVLRKRASDALTACPKQAARQRALLHVLEGDFEAAERKAAESRLAGVKGNKRRRHYGHAADLVATCVECDRSPETAHWVAALRTEHRRFPALRIEFDRALGIS